MSKTKSAFFCQNCGNEAPKWLGKCPSCQEWNTFIEEIIDKSPKQALSFSLDLAAAKPLLIQEVIQEKEERIVIQDSELNTVLGGGF